MAVRYLSVLGLAGVVMLAGCAAQRQESWPPGPMGQGSHPGMMGEGRYPGMHHPGMMGEEDYRMGPPAAIARLGPTQGQKVSGVAIFHAKDDRLLMRVRVSGLEPGSEHGFHVHERGDCSAPDATSAGGHFNPTGKPHGPQSSEHHAGDLPNLKADATGRAEMALPITGLSAGSGETGIIGRALVIHAMPDDYRSQPAGNSGGRIACGVITAWQPPRQ